MKLKKKYLLKRGDIYFYRRGVPKDLRHLDARAPYVVKTLRTAEIATAKIRRDKFAMLDDRLWNALLQGENADSAREKYEADIAIAQALDIDLGLSGMDLYAAGFNKAMKLTAGGDLQTLSTDQLGEMVEGQSFNQVLDTVVNPTPLPFTTVKDAFELYQKEIIATDLSEKSEGQLKKWRNRSQASISLFVDVVGDKDITKITREDTQKFRRHILELINSGKIGANSANKKFSPMKKLWEEYMSHIGREDDKNPFRNMHFKEGPVEPRPPFSMPWLKTKLIAPELLGKLNEQARDIWLTMIDTGAREAEICNLRPETIILNAEVPHIFIRPEIEEGKKRQIKTHNSKRKIPLVGLALSAMKRNPNGFPRYQDNEEAFSATARKWLTANNLRETPKHVPYCLRHSFNDRTKMAGMDHELQLILAGHGIDRPRYGEAGTLIWKREQLQKIVFAEDVELVQ